MAQDPQRRDIAEGFRNLGYTTIGAAAMGWFDPTTLAGRHLTRSFEHFLYAGGYHLDRQLTFIEAQIEAAKGPTFTFLNVGETHVPYWHQGAPWSASDNPCRPFQTTDRRADCQARQRACLEFVDARIKTLLQRHRDGTILICADHGDCWGEDGLWEHGIMHEMTTTVPLLIRLRGRPIARTEVRKPTEAQGFAGPGWPARFLRRLLPR